MVSAGDKGQDFSSGSAEGDFSPQAIEAARAKLRQRFDGAIGKALGGKGTARRKVKRIHKSTTTDEKKVIQTAKKMGAQDVPGIEEVQMFHEDGSVTCFMKPKINVAPSANTYVVTGDTVKKSSDDVIKASKSLDALYQKLKMDPTLLEKACADPEFAKQLKKLEEAAKLGEKDGAVSSPKEQKIDAMDEIPELVENFEEVSKQ